MRASCSGPCSRSSVVQKQKQQQQRQSSSKRQSSAAVVVAVAGMRQGVASGLLGRALGALSTSNVFVSSSCSRHVAIVVAASASASRGGQGTESASSISTLSRRLATSTSSSTRHLFPSPRFSSASSSISVRALSTDAAAPKTSSSERNKKDVAAAAAVELPTSDESDELLRIRHSVSSKFLSFFLLFLSLSLFRAFLRRFCSLALLLHPHKSINPVRPYHGDGGPEAEARGADDDRALDRARVLL